MKQVTLQRIKAEGLLAVIRGSSDALTLKMVDALIAGGVIGIEITFTTHNALSVVETLAKGYGDEILLGMGTLTEDNQAGEALRAGATFLVSPHTEQSLAKAMLDTGLVIMVGALTPSEIVAAQKYGADIVKIFPGSLVGPAYIKALKGPYPGLQVMPTGGVTKENIVDWFAAGAVAVGAGSNLCPEAWAKDGRFSDITANAREFKQIVESARL